MSNDLEGENGILTKDSGICMGASVGTCYYHPWPGLRTVLDLDEDSPNAKKQEGPRYMVGV
jgi:hypothetical protein